MKTAEEIRKMQELNQEEVNNTFIEEIEKMIEETATKTAQTSITLKKRVLPHVTINHLMKLGYKVTAVPLGGWDNVDTIVSWGEERSPDTKPIKAIKSEAEKNRNHVIIGKAK